MTDQIGKGNEPTLLAGIGVNVAAHRRAAGVTQAELAQRIGKSVQWVSAVEQGRRHADRLTDLIRIAVVVGCQVEDLIGRPVDMLAPGGRPRAEAVALVGEVMMRAAVPVSPVPGEAVTLDEIGDRVAEAWTIWHGSPSAHSLLGGLLPGILSDVSLAYQVAAEDERRRAARTVAGAYQVTRQWLHHIPDGNGVGGCRARDARCS